MVVEIVVQLYIYMLGIARYNNAGFLVLMPRSYVACRLLAQGILCSPFLGWGKLTLLDTQWLYEYACSCFLNTHRQRWMDMDTGLFDLVHDTLSTHGASLSTVPGSGHLNLMML